MSYIRSGFVAGSDGALSGVRAGLHGGPVDEVVSVERRGTATLFIFEDGSRLELQTGELLRELLDAEIVSELVSRVIDYRDRIEELA